METKPKFATIEDVKKVARYLRDHSVPLQPIYVTKEEWCLVGGKEEEWNEMAKEQGLIK